MTVSASGMYWGLANQCSEHENGTGGWQPNSEVRYQFYATTIYDDKQESNPQLFTMYSTQALFDHTGNSSVGNIEAQEPTLQLAFSDGYNPRNSAHNPGEIGNNVAISLCPVLKLNGADHAESGSNPGGASGDYNFGAADVDARTLGNPRITGIRCYYASNEDGYNEKWLLYEWDFKKGIRPIGSGSRQTDSEGFVQPDSTRQDSSPSSNGYWYQHVHGDGIGGLGFKWLNPPKVYNYTTMNLHPPDDIITLDSFKTSCIANGRAWVGNYVQDGVKYMDSMIKSPVGCYDKFPSVNKVLIVSNDGDSIVKLIEYADRILQFKKNKLFIINIATADEYVEGEYEYKGVTNPGAVCKTDYGIVWANPNGAYLYDGQGIKDLFIGRDGLPKMNSKSFFDDTNQEIIVGWDQRDKNVLFINADSSSGEGYIYNIPLQSWTQGDHSNTTDGKWMVHTSDSLSNFITIDGKLSIFRSAKEQDNGGDEYKRISRYTAYEDVSATNSCKLVTKKIDFGNANRRKKLYNVVFNYKNGNGITAKISTNDGAFTSIGTLDSNTGSWVREVKSLTGVNNIYTVQIQLTGTFEPDFELDDISIVFREKTVK